MILQHILAAFLIFLGPVWDHFEIRKLKIGTDPRRKVRFYRLIVAVTWIFSAIAVFACGWPSIFSIQTQPGELSWLPKGEGAHAIMIALLAGFLAAVLAPMVLMRRSPRYAASIEKAFKPLAFILPATVQQRRWWILVSLTAGIGEEILCRGFLIQYFRHAPLHLGVVAAAILAAVVFGFAHMYQGAKGIVGTGLLGLVFSAIFIISGNLLLPMIIHFLIDVRVLVLLPAEASLSPETV